MDKQEWQTVFMLIIALTTVVYTAGTFLLWKVTRNAFRLNIVMALRTESGLLRPSGFTRLIQETFPKEAGKLIAAAIGEGVKEDLKNRSLT